ncbi:MAG: hypothetical protein JWM36_3147 [Hyphomicrobiales bacterium]|nr:hypothetical protein [Hyphomicrobiales bacterium]
MPASFNFVEEKQMPSQGQQHLPQLKEAGITRLNPMRGIFASICKMVHSKRPQDHLGELTRLSFQLMYRARDPQEAGAAAAFASMVMIYARGVDGSSAELTQRRLLDLEEKSNTLAAVIVLRKCRIKSYLKTVAPDPKIVSPI